MLLPTQTKLIVVDAGPRISRFATGIVSGGFLETIVSCSIENTTTELLARYIGNKVMEETSRPGIVFILASCAWKLGKRWTVGDV